MRRVSVLVAHLELTLYQQLGFRKCRPRLEHGYHEGKHFFGFRRRSHALALGGTVACAAAFHQVTQAETEGGTDRLIRTASKITSDIDAALRKVSNSTEDAGRRVTFLGPLIEARRAALDNGGFVSSDALDKALAQAGNYGNEAARTAEQSLQRAEMRWRQVLEDLEADANTELKARLRIGERAPNFKLASTNGRTVALSELLAEGPSSVLLIWLRHFG